MTYSISANDREEFEITFQGEPNYVYGFRMAPKSREVELNSGDWLILSFVLWNSNYRPAIEDALAVAQAYGGRFKLAARPFERASEFDTWLSGLNIVELGDPIIEYKTGKGGLGIEIRGNKSDTPFWFWLRDGVLVSQLHGPMSRGY